MKVFFSSNFIVSIPLRIKWNEVHEYTVSEMIAKRNTSNAYIIREGKFNSLFSGESDVWHIIQRFGKFYYVRSHRRNLRRIFRIRVLILQTSFVFER